MDSFKTVLVLFICSILIGTSCSTIGVTYPVSQFDENKYLNRKLKNKEVDIRKIDGSSIQGYFDEMGSDSLAIVTKGETGYRMKIARKEIKNLKVIEKTHREVVILISTLAAFVVVSSYSLASALNSAY